jgi:hypothetical protein
MARRTRQSLADILGDLSIEEIKQRAVEVATWEGAIKLWLASRPHDLSEEVLDRILNKVEKRHVPASLRDSWERRDHLCNAIAWALTWYKTEVDTSPAARRQRQQLFRRIRSLNKTYFGRNKTVSVPGVSLADERDLCLMLKRLDGIAANFPEPSAKTLKPIRWRTESRPGRYFTPTELLAGWHLPHVFKRFFEQDPGFSRGIAEKPFGPCIDFVDAVLTEFEIRFARESIAAAIAAARKKLKPRYSSEELPIK